MYEKLIKKVKFIPHSSKNEYKERFFTSVPSLRILNAPIIWKDFRQDISMIDQYRLWIWYVNKQQIILCIFSEYFILLQPIKLCIWKFTCCLNDLYLCTFIFNIFRSVHSHLYIWYFLFITFIGHTILIYVILFLQTYQLCIIVNLHWKDFV